MSKVRYVYAIGFEFGEAVDRAFQRLGDIDADDIVNVSHSQTWSHANGVLTQQAVFTVLITYRGH